MWLNPFKLGKEDEVQKGKHLGLHQLFVLLLVSELDLQPGLGLDLGLGNWLSQRRAGLAPPTPPAAEELPDPHCCRKDITSQGGLAKHQTFPNYFSAPFSKGSHPVRKVQFFEHCSKSL